MKTSRFIICFVLLVFCSCAARTDVIILDERLGRLEKQSKRQKAEIQKYGKNTDVKEKNLRNQSASLRVEISSMREEVQTLTGRIEQIEFELNKDKKARDSLTTETNAQIGKLKESSDSLLLRLATIERYLDMEAAGTKSTGKSAVGVKPEKTSVKKLSEKELYKVSKKSFDEGDLDAAREGFQELIKRYPKSENADNAQFWIGEIYYREKWYEKAIVEYQKVIENYPKGNKVKSSLLKQGYAFNNIGDKTNARLILKELIRKYPKSNEAKIAKQKLSQLK
jgi:tol-pal system protein YbgF